MKEAKLRRRGCSCSNKGCCRIAELLQVADQLISMRRKSKELADSLSGDERELVTYIIVDALEALFS